MATNKAPLWQQLKTFVARAPVSFHVPGHKNGQILPHSDWEAFQSLLTYDVTELPDLDDLHHPTGVIKEAEELARRFFRANETYFLVNGSTVGNLVMILSTVKRGDTILVQKNCHKSVINAIELSQATPVFVSPQYDHQRQRYTHPPFATIKKVIEEENIKAIFLTYPDYYGTVYDLKKIIDYVHQHDVIVLVDEAHGVHFSIEDARIPASSLHLGADLVVQSAHKMAPALTMSAYLHVGSMRIEASRVRHYLQMLQSSSPSYLLMASLDLARYFLQELSSRQLTAVLESIEQVRAILAELDGTELVAPSTSVDPFKLTLVVEPGYDTKQINDLLISHGIYIEMMTPHVLLFVHGLSYFNEMNRLKEAMKDINLKLKNIAKHDTIDNNKAIKTKPLTRLCYTYQAMLEMETMRVALNECEGYVAAEAIVPYPPGIPLILKGESIDALAKAAVEQMVLEKRYIQNDITEGILVFKGAN